MSDCVIFDKSKENADRHAEPIEVKISLKKTMLVTNKTSKLPDSEANAWTKSFNALTIPDSPDIEVFIMQVDYPRGRSRGLYLVNSVGTDFTHGSQP